MEQRRKKSSNKKVIPLDGDKLGLIGGLIGAIAVLLLSTFLNRGDLATTLIRVGWAFVICYGATFFLVRMILRTTLQEMIEQDKAQREKKKKKIVAEEETAVEVE